MFLWGLWIDPLYLVLLVVTLVISGASQLYIRALVMLRETGMLTRPEDEEGVKRVLTAAALTYVAAAVTSILTLLYYISLARR